MMYVMIIVQLLAFVAGATQAAKAEHENKDSGEMIFPPLEAGNLERFLSLHKRPAGLSLSDLCPNQESDDEAAPAVETICHNIECTWGDSKDAKGQSFTFKSCSSFTADQLAAKFDEVAAVIDQLAGFSLTPWLKRAWRMSRAVPKPFTFGFTCRDVTHKEELRGADDS